MSYYAVAHGNKPGIFSNWNDCSESVKGYKNAKFKKFSIRSEAEDFILSNSNIKLKDIIFYNVDLLCSETIIVKHKVKKIIRGEQRNEVDLCPSICEALAEADPDKSEYFVYTDGACSRNGSKNSSAGIGIFFGENDIRNVSEKLFGKQTNNSAELTAILKLYYIIEDDIKAQKKITIVTDSEYAIKCLTTYGNKCSMKNWNVDIPNKILVKKIYELYTQSDDNYKDKSNINFIHIRAHTKNTDIHSLGNQCADNLAQSACF